MVLSGTHALTSSSDRQVYLPSVPTHCDPYLESGYLKSLIFQIRVQVQFLDGDHVLLCLGPPDAPLQRSHEPPASHSFLVVLCLSQSKVREPEPGASS